MSARVLLGSVALGMSFASSAFAAPTISVGGACPGVVDIFLTGATANGSTALITGTAGGMTNLAAGPCAGTVVPVGGAKIRAVGNADALGERQLHPNLAAGACNTSALWLDNTTCLMSPVTTLSPACAVPDYAWIPTPSAGNVMADPAFFTAVEIANVGAGLREDFEFGDPAGAVPFPASMLFEFYDGAGTFMCDIIFDIGQAVADPAYTATAIDPITFGAGPAVSVTGGVIATLADGSSTCGPLNPGGGIATTYGVTQLEDLFVGDWQFGYNVLSKTLNNEIQAAINGAGGDYANDFKPFIIGHNVAGVELGYAATYDRTCSEVLIDPVTLFLVLLNKPANGVVTEHAETFAWYAFGL
jgi:hypothetical protein